MKIGLFFGSFNPIHVGHLIIAQNVQEKSDLDQVWFIVSPQNPFKKSNQLASEFDRLDMVRAAIFENPNLHASNIEFHMPKPSYTADTLAYLKDQYPQHHFSPIIGGDNLENFNKWKNFEVILNEYGLIVYPRPGAKEHTLMSDPRVKKVIAPYMDISASYIRKAIQKGESVRYLLTEEVREIIFSRKLYHS